MQASAQPGVLIDAILPRTGALARVNKLAIDATLVVGFALLVALCAQIAFRIPTTTVPITGQTFGVLLAGGALGSRRGGLSMAVYMLLGFILPVFAPGSSYLGEKSVHFILPWNGTEGMVWDLSSGGYIVGFILAGYVVGLLAERGWDRRTTVPLAMIAGNICVYAIGLPWLAWHIETNQGLYDYFQGVYPGAGLLEVTLKGGLFPFIGGDALKLIAAALVLPGTWALVDRLAGRPPGQQEQVSTRGDG